MKHPWLLLYGFLLPACTLLHRVPRPLHAPQDEAAKMTLPSSIQGEGVVHVEGNLVAAIQLAMDHFQPWGLRPSPEQLDWMDECQFQRQSYDVAAAPAAEGVVLVRFTLNEDVCHRTKGSVDAKTGKPPVDVFTYAIDIRTWRILSIGTGLKRNGS
jgi:hypothetical protein